MRILFLLLTFTVELASAQKGVPVRVEGTHVRMIPPENFEPSKNFFGFQDISTGSSIMVIEMDEPFSEISGGFEKDLLSKKFHVASIHDIIFQDHPGKWIIAIQRTEATEFLKYILLFGDEQRTIMVISNSPERMNKLSLSLKESILTTRYFPNMKVDPLKAIPFTIDTWNTPFKLSNVISGAASFTTSIASPSKGSHLIVASSVAPVNTSDFKQHALDRFRGLPRGETYVIEQVEDVMITDLNGYEIIASGIDPDSIPLLIYMTILYTTENYYYVIGGVGRDGEVDAHAFRKIAMTFSPR